MRQWAPAGLPPQLLQLVRAIEATFAPRLPDNPPRLPAIDATNLTADLAGRNPYSLAIDRTNGKLVIAVPDGAGAYEWRNADGSAL